MDGSNDILAGQLAGPVIDFPRYLLGLESHPRSYDEFRCPIDTCSPNERTIPKLHPHVTAD